MKTRKLNGERIGMWVTTALILPVMLSACVQTKQSADPNINLTNLPSDICGEDHVILAGRADRIETSPDSQWMLVNCESKLHDDKNARVFRLDGSRSWSIPLSKFDWIKKDHPLRSVSSSNWTSDGKYVYLQPAVEFDPTNHGVFVTSYSLYRLDLQTGEFSVVLSGKETDVSPFSTKFSPDGKYLAYVDLDRNPNIVNLLGLQSMDLQSVKLADKYIDAGAFVWTRDSKQLVFVAAFDGWEDLKTGVSLFSLDINTFSLQTIIYDDTRLLFPYDDWIDNNTLPLGEFMDGTMWTVNIQTGVIEPDTRPTPTSEINLH